MKTFPEIRPIAPKAQSYFPVGDEWVYELKYDGYRGVLYLENGEAKLLTKNGKRLSVFRHLEGELAKCLASKKGKNRMILDGEVCALDTKGKPERGEIGRRRASLAYIAFDIMWLGDKDLRELPFLERKKILRKLLGKSIKGCVIFASPIKEGELFYRLVCKEGLEGVVAKRITSPYSRSTLWIKIKNPDYRPVKKSQKSLLFRRV